MWLVATIFHHENFLLCAFVAVFASFLECNHAKPETTDDFPLQYPVTRTVDSVDNFHGTDVPDPYRWLEALDEAEVRDWAAEQTSLAKNFFGDSITRKWFANRISAHAMSWEIYEENAPQSADPNSVRLEFTDNYQRQRAVVIEADGSTSILADPGASDPGISVSRVVVSPDGTHAIIQYSAAGSEWLTTRIVNISDKVMLDETLDGLRWSSPIWTKDSKGFFYIHYGKPTSQHRVALKGTALHYHKLGVSQEADHIVWSTPPDDVELILNIQLSPNGRFIVISEGTGAHTDGLDQLMARLLLLDLGETMKPHITRRPALITEDYIAGYRLVGEGKDGTLHVITDRDAPRRHIMAIDPSDMSPSSWLEIIPQHEDVLDRIYQWGDYYVSLYLSNAQSVVRVYTIEGQLRHTIELPSYATVDRILPGSSENKVAIGHSSYLQPPTYWHVDLETGSVREDEPPPLTLTGGPYQVTQVYYPSRNGVKVPMFIVHRSDLVLDGSHPVVMHGYGASHTPTLPFYDETVLAWLEAGGVYAVPNVRGGGAFGRDWWEAAILERKQTTFDDFIAAGEYLINAGWTNPDRLAIKGTSFGGLLVTAVMTERPDLFAAVVADVPAADLVRFNLGRHRAQMGSPEDPDQFTFVLRHSPLHRVENDQCYPATLITTAFNDERVPAWVAFKLTAALQAAQACPRPIVMRADQFGGHTGRTWAALEEHWVDWLTFVAISLDMHIEKSME